MEFLIKNCFLLLLLHYQYFFIFMLNAYCCFSDAYRGKLKTYNAESMHDACLRGVLDVDQFVAVLVI